MTISVTLADKLPGHEHIPIVHQESEISPDGSYKNSFESGNGIVVHEEGIIKDHGPEQTKVVHGSYQYVYNGDVVKVNYVADEHGFHPDSDILPTPPPTPEAILKLLDYLNAHPDPHPHPDTHPHPHPHPHPQPHPYSHPHDAIHDHH